MCDILTVTAFTDITSVQKIYSNTSLHKQFKPRLNTLFSSQLSNINSTVAMSSSQHSCKAKSAKYTKQLQIEPESMIAYACYKSDNILTSRKTMKKELLCNMVFESIYATA